MTKIEAILTLMRDARSAKNSTSAAKRAVKACKALGLTDAETTQIMAWLEYCDASGAPNGPAGMIERVWP